MLDENNEIWKPINNYEGCYEASNKGKEIKMGNTLDNNLVSRQAVKEQMIKYGFHAPDMTVTEFVEGLPSVSTEKTKIDWNYGEIKDLTSKYHPAILNKYLDEDLCIKNSPPVSTEKTGRWEWNQYDYNPNLGNWHCSECGSIAMECVPKKDPSGVSLYKYCPNCGAKMEVEE